MASRKFKFTLIELLVVIAILAILMSILLPGLNRARDKAKQIQCSGQLRQLGQAMHMYSNDYAGFFPWHNAPWGHAIMVNCLVEDGAGLYSNYVPKKEVFYCPYRGLNKPNMLWSPNAGGSDTWISYEYLCWRGFSNTPKRNTDNPAWAMMCDLSDPDRFGVNHIYGFDWSGANTVYVDGHLTWRNRGDIKSYYTTSSASYWY